MVQCLRAGRLLIKDDADLRGMGMTAKDRACGPNCLRPAMRWSG